MLETFKQPLNAVVVGASGGLGGAFCAALAPLGTVYGTAREPKSLATLETHSGVKPLALDLTQEEGIAQAAEAVDAALEGAGLDLVLVATGLLHAGALQPEKTWRRLEASSMAQVFAINTTGPALVAKHFLPLLAKDRKSVFAALSARVGSISDNRAGGWHSYRASKAALNMLLKNFAIELGRKNAHAVVAGLHPGTVDSDLSQPFQGNVPEGKLFTPAFSAEALLKVLDGLTPEQTGRVFAWDGQEVPA